MALIALRVYRVILQLIFELDLIDYLIFPTKHVQPIQIIMIPPGEYCTDHRD